MKKKELYGKLLPTGYMHTVWAGQLIQFYDEIDSTNVKAKAEADKGAVQGTLIVADMQTAGKGRRGRVWDSPAGKNLYFTLILKPDFEPGKASMLTLVMALAVAKGVNRAIAEMIGSEDVGSVNLPRLQIKWPNDIIINGKKICGILTEMSTRQNIIEHVLIGVGINVYKQEFSSELVDKATCIELECGRKVSREALLENIMEAFEEYYDIFESCGNLAGLRDSYNSKLVNCNREVCVLDPCGEYRGTATGINDMGELCVTLPDGSLTQVYAGEVSVRGVYGYV